MTDCGAYGNKKEFRCIVADDSAFARKCISDVLGKMGGRIVGEAANGLEAIELYAKHNPDIVMLDITMPVIDGIETLRRIVEMDKNAKVVIVSSIGDSNTVWKALCLGAKSFVSKPIDQDYAGMVIRDVVSGKVGT
jgi:two-component system chemotaxis response regulator CheY